MTTHRSSRPGLRIAIVTSFPADPDRPRGGVEAVSVNLARALARFQDLDVHVVTTDRDCASPSTSAWSGVTLHRLPWEGRRILRHATGPGRRRVQACLREIAPDVVHAHDFYGLMTQGMDVPRVFTIHGFIHADTLYQKAHLRRMRAWLWRRAERACWAEQPHVVAISPYVREHLRGIATGVIHDIDNPIDEGCFAIAREECPATIFSAALLMPRKNTLGLVEAFDRLVRSGVDARLELAGGTSDEVYAGRVRDSIRDRGLAGRVELLGPLPMPRIREHLARASLFALVSFEEGAPMGIAEAMAAGVPVVTSNRCGMPYMVRDGETGFLVDPHDPEDIAGRMRAILQNDALRAAIGCRSRQVAEDRFHPDRVAARTRAVYYRAAGRSEPDSHGG